MTTLLSRDEFGAARYGGNVGDFAAEVDNDFAYIDEVFDKTFSDDKRLAVLVSCAHALTYGLFAIADSIRRHE
jgi:hypothetical protein